MRAMNSLNPRWISRCLCTCTILHAGRILALAADSADLTVPLPLGTTLLQDIGAYRGGWQSYDAAPVYMPMSWSGHFDAATGISFQPWGKVLGRDALLMHSSTKSQASSSSPASPWHSATPRANASATTAG